jgi:hypothetical protein
MSVEVVPLGEIVDVLSTGGLALDADAVPAAPITLVDLDRGEAATDALGVIDRLRSTRVLIGICTRPTAPGLRHVLAALDCTLMPEEVVPADSGSVYRSTVAVPDVHAAQDELVARVHRNPRAAIALTGLLRMTERLPVQDGLAAESAVYSMLLAGPEFARWRAARPARALPEFDRPAVLLRRAGDQVFVTIDRPERRNAFSREVRDGLADAVDLALADDSVRLVVAGLGPAFCSGGDLDEFGLTVDVTAAHLIRLDRSVAGRIHACRERVTVRLHGACIGAGIEIPSFAGSVHAEPGTVIQVPEVAMGLVPGAGGTVGVTRRIGRWRTAHLALTGARLDHTTALRWSLIDEVG